jgi:hypothetical protein
MIAVLEAPVAAPVKPQAKDRIEELQQTISASRLGLWHSCRLKFCFRYVLQLCKPPTPAMHCGSVVPALHAQRTRCWSQTSGLRA